MTTVDLKTDGAIQITASHHPFDRNGLKFFTKEGGIDGKDLTKIIETSCSVLNDLSSEISQTDDISVEKINKNGPCNRKLKTKLRII